MKIKLLCRRKIVWYAFMVGVVLVQVIIILGHAAETVSTDKRPQSGQKIQITADELISSGQDNYAEFIGNVEVIQGTFLIKSDRLRIYYKSYRGDSKTPTMGEE
jgi:lipopolysaccharide export system protein LptA